MHPYSVCREFVLPDEAFARKPFEFAEEVHVDGGVLIRNDGRTGSVSPILPPVSMETPGHSASANHLTVP